MRKASRQFRAAAAMWLVAGTVAACGDRPAGDRIGLETDSAGVVVVENPADGLWGPNTRWQVDEDLRIGTREGSGEYQFGNIAGIEVGPAGQIFVLDQQAQEIRSFDKDGRFLQRFGSPGSGPGELTIGASAIMLGRNDTLLVPDLQTQRVNLYSVAGGEAGSFPISLEHGVPIKWLLTPDDEIVHQTMTVPGQEVTEMRNQLLLRGMNGVVHDTILTLPSSGRIQMGNRGPQFQLFGTETVWSLTQDGLLVAGSTDAYRIEVRRIRGELERVVTKQFEPQRVSESDRDVYLEALERTFESHGVPPEQREVVRGNLSFSEYYPAFINIMGGPDGTIFVQHVRTPDHVVQAEGAFNLQQDIGGPDWDVFDRDGGYLGLLQLPTRFHLMLIDGEFLYGVWKDRLDVQYVMRLRIVRAG